MNSKFLLLFIAFFCLMGLGSMAQTTGWESGVNLSGGTSFPINVYNTNMSPPPSGAKRVQAFQYSAGVYGRKFFKEKFGIEFGVQYTSMAAGVVAKGLIIDQTGNGIGDFTMRITDRLNYVEMPLHFVFKRQVGRFDLGFYAGVSPAVLTHANTRNVSHLMGDRNTEKYNITDNSRRFNLFADAGFLFRVNVTDHFAVDLKPYFRASTLPVFSQSNSDISKQYLMSTGLSVGTVWKF